MKHILKLSICILFLGSSMIAFGQNDTYKLETNYMNCMYSLFDDNGVEFKTLLKKAEQNLISAELLPNGNGESYMSLYKNLRMAIDGRMANFGVSDYVIKKLQGNENIKKYFILSPLFF